ncbi:MAG: squalene/phytoene synthase family protein [bacterium]|nr:squalene/phytoene synthase family protein [bacterium]
MPDQKAIRKAYDYCDRIARQRAHNFYPAFRFLPKPRRLALSAFYTFCSLSDDISDDSENLSHADRLLRLSAWRDSLLSAFDHQSEDVVFMALGDAIRRFDLPRQLFLDLLQGIEMDLQPRAYQTFEDLSVYCRCVASSVGLVSLRIFGCTEPRAEDYADNLGIAFQLTNVMRDVSEDLQRGRVYLPVEDLDKFGVTIADLQACRMDDRFTALMQFEYNRAVSFFEKADPNLAGNQKRKLLTAEIMKAVYRRTLEELRSKRFRVLGQRIKLSPTQKIFTVGSKLAQSLFW